MLYVLQRALLLACQTSQLPTTLEPRQARSGQILEHPNVHQAHKVETQSHTASLVIPVFPVLVERVPILDSSQLQIEWRQGFS
jgi:hypothetical protein